jgi:hypothetical protein
MVKVVAIFVTIGYCCCIQSGIFTIRFDLDIPQKKSYIKKYKLKKEQHENLQA